MDVDEDVDVDVDVDIIAKDGEFNSYICVCVRVSYSLIRFLFQLS